MIYKERLINDTVAAIKEHNNAMTRALEENDRKYANNLKPGETMPAAPPISNEAAAAIWASADKACSQISQSFDLWKNVLKKDMGEAPSEEAARAIAMLQGRDTLTQPEFDAVAAVHGGTYMAAGSLADIAKKHGLTYENETYRQTKDEAERLEDAEKCALRHVHRPSGVRAREEASRSNLDASLSLVPGALSAIFDGDSPIKSFLR